MRRSFSTILAEQASADPDRIVVEDARGSLTSAELDRASNRLARVLLERGVVRDDLVTIVLPNDRDFVVATAAVWKAGATPQPIDVRLRPAQRTAAEGAARPALVLGAVAQHPGIPSIVDLGDADGESDAALPDAWARSWKAPTTSGSTGTPKVVLAAAPALMDPDAPVAAFLPRSAVQLVAGPLSHSATFTYAMRGLLLGHRLVVLPRFDEERWIAAVQRHRVTWALVVPTMMHRMLRLPAALRTRERVATLETVLHMGAPCAPALKRAFLDWIGPERVVEVYAGSESNGLTMIRGDEWLAHPGSVGRPIGGTEVRVLLPGGADAAPGETGEVWMRRGPEPAYRYLGATSRRDPDGWDTLGDLGYLDADGRLYLVDRAGDVIVRGGETVHPVEVERVLEAHPAVRSAVAFGVPDDDLGQRVEAVADIADADTDAAALAAWAAEHLDPARRPARIRLVREPVRDDAGKTSRRCWAATAADA
ncbi:AMP-binding protein [Microbacterium sp. CJ88]|uniref:AMP-binding protein n=1 Tax=Microbacterium sp. CJ88 TaxID=3445672 RepID=UPI003F65FD31